MNGITIREQGDNNGNYPLARSLGARVIKVKDVHSSCKLIKCNLILV